MIVMATDTPDDSEPDAGQPRSLLGTNNSFPGALTPAELAAEIGRLLQVQHPAVLEEALPDELASLIRQLGERKTGKAD